MARGDWWRHRLTGLFPQPGLECKALCTIPVEGASLCDIGSVQELYMVGCRSPIHHLLALCQLGVGGDKLVFFPLGCHNVLLAQTAPYKDR